MSYLPQCSIILFVYPGVAVILNYRHICFRGLHRGSVVARVLDCRRSPSALASAATPSLSLAPDHFGPRLLVRRRLRGGLAFGCRGVRGRLRTPAQADSEIVGRVRVVEVTVELVHGYAFFRIVKPIFWHESLCHHVVVRIILIFR